jgi:glycylpeptide N-tetradecanoyltransferase
MVEQIRRLNANRSANRANNAHFPANIKPSLLRRRYSRTPPPRNLPIRSPIARKMAESKKPELPKATVEDDGEVEGATANEESADEELPATAEGTSAPAPKKKKKSKRKKVKEALTGSKGESSTGEIDGSGSSKVDNKLSSSQIDQLLRSNPALQNEVRGVPNGKVEELLKKMNLQDLLTGLAPGGKNQKDMASYKFWQTQPVPRFGECERGYCARGF